MFLTEAETEAAAERLARSSLQKDWATLSADERCGFRTVVKGLAAELQVEHTPAAVRVFMLWMGDDARWVTSADG